MKTFKNALFGLFAALLIAPAAASAADENSVVGVQGYDLVSYHNAKKPLPGNGNHVVSYKGVNYLFASDENKKTFEKSPEKYVPAYNGYCAYGVAVNKKFIGDPNVWDIVDGKLYLNLDNTIKGLWVKDVSGNIKKADGNWGSIQNVSAAELLKK